jgi:hypothetical protein
MILFALVALRAIQTPRGVRAGLGVAVVAPPLSLGIAVMLSVSATGRAPLVAPRFPGFRRVVHAVRPSQKTRRRKAEGLAV